MSKFKVGDRVTWHSQAQGTRTDKSGVVFYVVPPRKKTDKSIALYYLQSQHAENATRLTDFGGMVREEESYLVVVPGTGRKLPAVYWPRASALREDTSDV